MTQWCHMVSDIWVNIGSGNSLGPTMHQVVGTKSLPEPMMTYSQWDPKEHISMKFCWKISKDFHQKFALKMLSVKWQPFCSGLIVLRPGKCPLSWAVLNWGLMAAVVKTSCLARQVCMTQANRIYWRVFFSLRYSVLPSLWTIKCYGVTEVTDYLAPYPYMYLQGWLRMIDDSERSSVTSQQRWHNVPEPGQYQPDAVNIGLILTRFWHIMAYLQKLCDCEALHWTPQFLSIETRGPSQYKDVVLPL